jgi:hypothetical protein
MHEGDSSAGIHPDRTPWLNDFRALLATADIPSHDVSRALCGLGDTSTRHTAQSASIVTENDIRTLAYFQSLCFGKFRAKAQAKNLQVGLFFSALRP